MPHPVRNYFYFSITSCFISTQEMPISFIPGVESQLPIGERFQKHMKSLHFLNRGARCSGQYFPKGKLKPQLCVTDSLAQQMPTMCPPLPYAQCATSELSTEAQDLSRPQHLAGSALLAEKSPMPACESSPYPSSPTGCGLGSGHPFSWTEACSFCLANVPWHMLTEEVLGYIQEANSKPCEHRSCHTWMLSL